MFKFLLVLSCLWIFHSRAHMESDGDFLFFPQESVTTEDTPVKLTDIAGAEVPTGSRAWRPPPFATQTGVAGYNAESFKVPAGLERPVQFWTDIYTKYSTTQGVIHDAEYIDLVYEVVDFAEIEKRQDLNSREKEKFKKKAVNDAKERVSEILRRLNRNPDPTTLSLQEKRVWDYMRKIDNPLKYIEANDKNRLRFQLGQSDRMKKAIYFSGRYLEEFEQIFREAGLPMELTRLVFVESSFNVLARSKVGASGLWQIMPSVARPERMISSYVDRRNDPWDATRAAARLLGSNFKLLGRWPLAITGYNHGQNGIKKLTETYKTQEIVDLILNVKTKKNFGFASRNFYASFLAALQVEKNARTYFPDVQWSEKLQATPYKVKMALPFGDLVKVFDNNREQVEIYNPHLTSRVKGYGSFIPAGTKIYVPPEKMSLLEKKGRKVATDQPAS